ncbi:MAG: aspartate aminotransferase family protein [Halobacteriaceae archaeon]
MSGFVYSEKPIDIERGEGPYLYSPDGTEYLDVGASYACTPLGHSHPAVVEAAQAQLDDLTFVQCSYPNPTRAALYDQLADVTPSALEEVWLCNSGTEANEAAIKFARSATGRTKVVSTMRAFHGRTMGSLALTWKQKYREPFEPVMPDVEFVPYGDADALADAVDEDTAALFLEPVQGEGGVNPAEPAYLQAAREVTAEAGAALVFDEVQTGVGRCGELWACERAGVEPDVLTTAKGLANGLPLGATVVADWIADGAGPHGSTFSGGPVLAAAAGATLDTVIAEDLPANAAALGEYVREGARDLDGVREVRGLGLMIGIEVRGGANPVVRDLAMDHQILALPAGRTTVRLLPPLILDESHADRFLDALAEVLE